MIELARRLLMGASLACLAGAPSVGCVKPKPPQPPTPPPVIEPDPSALPPKGVPARLDLLLRQTAGKLHYEDGRPFQWFQAIQCCGGAGAVLGATTNTRWPMAGKAWQDYAAQYGANAFHQRYGFWLGDADHETEFADIGGPYKPGSLEWNPAFWQEAREQVWNAAKLNAAVEVVVQDSWWAKVCQWGRETCAATPAAVDSVGRRPDPENERFIRKVVEEVGCFGNVVWATDNEGDQIQGEKLSYFEWVADVIRDEERKSGCNVVHMIGSNSGHVSPKFDFLITHARAPLTQSLEGPGGRWSLNNERNPAFTPDQEAAYFAQAREKGLGWALWLADLQGEKVKRTFELFRDVAKGGVSTGCFSPPEDDPRWVGVPTRAIPPAILAALEQAKREVGDPGPAWRACVAAGETPIACMFPTLDALADSMRRQGLCAGRTRDAITAKEAGESPYWYELHATAATNGGYAGSAYKGSTWRLN